MLLQSDAVEQLLENNADGMYTALDAVLRVLVAETSVVTLAAGWNLYWGLAVILVVWTGLKRAFAGSLDMWEYWKLLFALGVPLTMLQAYDAPLRLTATLPITLPGSADPLTFPELLVAQGTWLAQEINDDGQEQFVTFLHSLGSKAYDTITFAEADANVSIWQKLNPQLWITAFGYSFLAILLALLALFVTAIALIIGWAQVMFAQVAIAVCIVLGPVLIPWILVSPMAFLFWGWFRSMITYGLYAAVSAAIFRVGLALLQGTTTRVMDAVDVGRLVSMTQAERMAVGPEAMFWMLTLLVCAVAVITSFLKIPSLAAGLVSGQAGGESIGAALGTVGVALGGAGKMAMAAAKK